MRLIENNVMNEQLQNIINCNEQLMQLMQIVGGMVPELQHMMLRMATELAFNYQHQTPPPALWLVPRIYQD